MYDKSQCKDCFSKFHYEYHIIVLWLSNRESETVDSWGQRAKGQNSFRTAKTLYWLSVYGRWSLKKMNLKRQQNFPLGIKFNWIINLQLFDFLFVQKENKNMCCINLFFLSNVNIIVTPFLCHFCQLFHLSKSRSCDKALSLTVPWCESHQLYSMPVCRTGMSLYNS